MITLFISFSPHTFLIQFLCPFFKLMTSFPLVLLLYIGVHTMHICICKYNVLILFSVVHIFMWLGLAIWKYINYGGIFPGEHWFFHFYQLLIASDSSAWISTFSDLLHSQCQFNRHCHFSILTYTMIFCMAAATYHTQKTLFCSKYPGFCFL